MHYSGRYRFIIFGLFAKAFAVHQKLIPEEMFLHRFVYIANLERGLIAGLIIFPAGLGLLFMAVMNRQRYNFGPVSCSDRLRTTIPRHNTDNV
jgi:hypothetical protein